MKTALGRHVERLRGLAINGEVHLWGRYSVLEEAPQDIRLVASIHMNPRVVTDGDDGNP